MSEELLISQSSLKSFYKKDACKLAWYNEWVLGVRREIDPVRNAAWLKGLIFEDVLIGSTRGGEKYSFPLSGVKSLKPTKSAAKGVKEKFLIERNVKLPSKCTSAELDGIIEKMPEEFSKGTKPKVQVDVENLANESKHILDDLGIVLDQVQPEIKYKIFVGHPDIYGFVNGEESFVDIKYTETAIDDRYRGWGAPEDMDHTQALFYVWLWKQISGRTIPFFYLVFGKSGWVKFLRMDISDATMAGFENFIMSHITDLKSFKPTPSPEYNKCLECMHSAGCESKAKLPQEEIVQI